METILLLDFGSQYTQLIARRIREQQVYSEILPCTVSLKMVREHRPNGIILSGGPASVYAPKAPLVDPELFTLGIPILGICYGMQLMAHLLGGRVAKATHREYGRAELQILEPNELFTDIVQPQELPPGAQLMPGPPKLFGVNTVWMSHGDRIDALPPGFKAIAKTSNSPYAAMTDSVRRFYAIQFHPEVAHTQQGTRMLTNFVKRICGCAGDWTMASFRKEAVERIRRQVGGERVVCAISGGVDSSVAATLVHEAVGDQLVCLFVDNGLLRADEGRKVKELFDKNIKIHVKYINASNEFLKTLRGVIHPEEKRKRIGRLFIRLFEREAKRLAKRAAPVRFLVQGTLYPDVIESVSFKGPSATIKTHHNVGGLPTKMRFQLIEPLRELFKDEVRRLGQELGLPRELLWRHPFPGPGLAIRVLGAVTPRRLALVRAADAIVEEEVRGAVRYDDFWQLFAVLLPIRTVGVMGDERTYDHVIAIRGVTSQDGMTADWAVLPQELLGRMANRIINEVKGINRVVYDITSKPPGTIEWE